MKVVETGHSKVDANIESTHNCAFSWLELTAILTRPIAFHRIFAVIGGNAIAGLFLSQAFYWTNRTKDPDGWFYKTQEQWFAETALIRSEQERARRSLKQNGLLEEKKQGLPCKIFYRINKTTLLQQLTQLTSKSISPNQYAEADTQECSNRQTGSLIPANSNVESDILSIYTETTSENKTEIMPPLPPKGEAHTPVLDEEALKSRLPSAPENIENINPEQMGLDTGNAEEITAARDNKTTRVREGDKYFGAVRHKRQQRSFAAKVQSTIIPIEEREPWCNKDKFVEFEAYLLEEAKTWDCKNPAGYVANKLSAIASGKAPRTEFNAWQESLREAEEAAQQAKLEAQAQSEEAKLTVEQETWVTLVQQLATVTGFIEVHVGEGVDCGVKKLMVRSNDKRLGTAPLETAMKRIPLNEFPKKYRQFYDEVLAKAKQIASHLQFPAPVSREEVVSW